MKTIRGEFRNLVVVGLPTTGMVDIDFAIDMMHMTLPVNTSPNLKVVRGKPVDEACNIIAQHALDIGAEYIYFREDDVLTPPGAFERLLARKVDIISGVCMSKQIPPFPIIFQTYGGGPYTDWYENPGDLIEVCGTGVACTLIKTSVFEQVPKPWFKTITSPQSQPEIDDKVIARMTQDMYFYRKAINAGFRVWVDTGVLCGHKDVNSGTLFYYDGALKLPAWLEKGAKEPSCIAPQNRTLRCVELTKEEKRCNYEVIEGCSALEKEEKEEGK